MYIPGKEYEYMQGACFDIGAGVAGAASAAAQIASTKMQVDAEKQARKTAINTANTQASNITNSANDANGYLSNTQAMGNNAISNLTNGLSESQLEATPGYKFILNQGEQGVTNSASARGLADSGAALKGASQYSTGLADNTYQNQFNDENALANEGYQANSQVGNNLMTATNNAAQTQMEGANGSMTTTVGAGNALASGLNNIGNTASQYSMYNSLLGNSGSSSSSDPFAGSGTSVDDDAANFDD